MAEKDFTAEEIMIVAAARALKNDDVCFVGIGAPSAACNLARLTHAPGIALIYESGTIGSRPDVLPLSIGDGELCETAVCTVPVPELFRYWLEGGRISVGFLGGAQIDRFGNINTTVIGDYFAPKTRLPGGGGAPEIAAFCGETFIVMKQSRRGFVEKLDFVTSLGHGNGGGDRAAHGVSTRGPALLVTDLCLMEPNPDTHEWLVTSVHPGVSKERIEENTGWHVRYAAELRETPAPSVVEIEVLRDLKARTARHSPQRGSIAAGMPPGSNPVRSDDAVNTEN